MNHQKKGQIESAKVVIREVFSNFWFSIPAYQRSYVWGKDEISELIDDVNYASQHSPDGQYFLGSMVLQKDSIDEQAGGQQVSYDVHHLLDGQQRLTTLFLMTAVIRDLTGEEKLRKKCREMLFQEENSWDNTPGRNRIVYQIRDNVGEFIEHFVKPDGGTLLKDDLGGYERENNLSLSNMARAIRTMRERFTGWQPEEFGRFTKYLFNNALFIYVATEDLDDAFRLFTILNDRGIPLSNSDILKARNLGEVKEPKENAKWAEFWEDIEGELGRDEFDRFLSFVRTIYVKDKAREGLLKEFDERIYGTKPPLLTLGTATFKAVQDYKMAYDEAVLFNPLPDSLGNDYRNLITMMLRTLPATDWIPAVLAWYRKFKANELLPFLKKLDNKFSADWILQLTPTQRIQNMNDVLKKIEQAQTPADVFKAKSGDELDALLNPGVFDYDKQALMGILAGDIYGRRFAKYVLLRLEYLFFNHSSVLNLPDALSVEHIFPQNPAATSKWMSDFTNAERAQWLHKLGNLMMLSRRKNTSLGNLDFVAKKARYFANSVETLPNSARVLILPEFSLASVQSRHDELLAKLRASY